MSKLIETLLKALPARMLELSVEFGSEPSEAGQAIIERDLLSSPEQVHTNRMLLIDLFQNNPAEFRPLMENGSTNDLGILRAFDNALEDKLAGKITLISFFWLTGTTFKDVKENIAEMSDNIAQGIFTGKIQLIPNPSNAYDPNCIDVTTANDGRLGFVPMKLDINKEVKLHMEAGRFVAAQLAMLETGKKGPMIGIACGWNMPEKLMQNP